MTLKTLLFIGGVVLLACVLLLQIPTSLAVSAAQMVFVFAMIAAMAVFAFNRFSSNREG